MRRYLGFTVVCALLAATCFGQTRNAIDRLQTQLRNAKDDTSKINAQVFLCLAYRLGNTDSALFYGRKALKESEEFNYLKGQVMARAFMAITFEQLGDLPEALRMSFKSWQLAKENKLEYLATASLNAIGETYVILKDYRKAINYFNLQKALDQKSGNDESLAYGLLDIGITFNEMGQLDSANYYEQQALIRFAKIKRQEPIVYKTLGDIAFKKSDMPAALKEYQLSLRIAIDNNESRAIGFAYNKIAMFYKNQGRTDSAIYYAQKGLKQSQAIGRKVISLEAANLLSALYEQKDAKVALSYLKIANSYKESLFGTNNIYAVQALAAQEEAYQKELEANRISFQNKLKLYSLLLGLGIVLLVAMILYRNNRQKQKANYLLSEQKEEIAVQRDNLSQALLELKNTQAQLVQREKMASLGELTAGIAHEIQNPLNFVNNFSEVSIELLQELKEEEAAGNKSDVLAIADDLEQNLQKINHHGKRADGIVKGMLEHSKVGAGEKQLTDINTLAGEFLKLSYHGMLAKNKSFKAEIVTSFDEHLPKVKVAQQDIGRVLLNLFNNAFYAINQKQKTSGADYKPIVTVTTTTEDKHVAIKVSDNGIGIPDAIKAKIMQPFFTTKPTGEGTGLGLSLSYDILVSGHGGSITVDSTEGVGSDFTIILPIN
ncbi:MAG TPA: ATP-binding protein [Mucilaginibacter sp.]|nr:ATP-binding protein [Mucilaginibacter sp.]